MPRNTIKSKYTHPPTAGNAYHLVRLLAGIQCSFLPADVTQAPKTWKSARLERFSEELAALFLDNVQNVKSPSYNTLRNLWGSNDSVEPSIATLDAVAKFWASKNKLKGIENWASFVDFVDKMSPWASVQLRHELNNLAAPLDAKSLGECDPEWFERVFEVCCKDYIAQGALRQIPNDHQPSRVEIARRRNASYSFIGRSVETDLLLSWLVDKTASVVGLSDAGGMGKTSFVWHFLENILPTRQYFGLDGVFAWSFYGQGTDNKAQAESSFYEALAKFLRIESPTTEEINSPSYGDSLFEAFDGQIHTLLVFDGLEVLQDENGSLLDDTLYQFLMRIAQKGSERHSLVILTSRKPYTELNRFAGFRAMQLGGLSDEEGKKLLLAESALEFEYSAGVEDAVDELKATSRAYNGHPLSLVLFARLLRGLFAVESVENGQLAKKGDTRRVAEFRNLVETFFSEHTAEFAALEIGVKLKSLLLYYEAQLANESPTTVTILRALSLIDRPVEPKVWEVLREVLIRVKAIPQDLKAEKAAFLRLHQLRLVQEHGLKHDIHPLLRAYFAYRLSKTDKTLFLTLHFALGQQFEHEFLADFQHRPQPIQIFMSDVERIGRAIYHTSLAEEFARAFEQLYGYFGNQKGGNYLTDSMGALRSNRQFLAWMVQPEHEKWHTLPELLRREMLDRYSTALYGLGFLDLAFRMQERLQQLYRPDQLAAEDYSFWKLQMVNYLRMQVYMDVEHADQYGRMFWSMKFAQADPLLREAIARQVAYIAHLRGFDKAEIQLWLTRSSEAYNEWQATQPNEIGFPFTRLEDWFWSQLPALNDKEARPQVFEGYAALRKVWGEQLEAIIYAAEALTYHQLGQVENTRKATQSYIEALPRFQHAILTAHSLAELATVYSQLYETNKQKKDLEMFQALMSKLERAVMRCNAPALAKWQLELVLN
jgi:hypothetical protein